MFLNTTIKGIKHALKENSDNMERYIKDYGEDITDKGKKETSEVIVENNYTKGIDFNMKKITSYVNSIPDLENEYKKLRELAEKTQKDIIKNEKSLKSAISGNNNIILTLKTKISNLETSYAELKAKLDNSELEEVLQNNQEETLDN